MFNQLHACLELYRKMLSYSINLRSHTALTFLAADFLRSILLPDNSHYVGGLYASTITRKTVECISYAMLKAAHDAFAFKYWRHLNLTSDGVGNQSFYWKTSLSLRHQSLQSVHWLNAAKKQESTFLIWQTLIWFAGFMQLSEVRTQWVLLRKNKSMLARIWIMLKVCLHETILSWLF